MDHDPTGQNLVRSSQLLQPTAACSYLLFPFSTQSCFWEADFAIAAWVDLGPTGVFGSVPCHTIATKLVVLPILSCWTFVVVTVVAEPVVLWFCKSNAEDSEEEESLELDIRGSKWS